MDTPTHSLFEAKDGADGCTETWCGGHVSKEMIGHCIFPLYKSWMFVQSAVRSFYIRWMVPKLAHTCGKLKSALSTSAKAFGFQFV